MKFKETDEWWVMTNFGNIWGVPLMLTFHKQELHIIRRRAETIS